MLEFIEEALDEITPFVEALAEGRQIGSIGHKSDIGARALCSEALAQGVGIVGSVTQKHIAATERAHHVLGAASVMGLAFGDLQENRQAAGIDKDMDFRSQPAPRATHATGSISFFWVLAAC